MIAVNPENQETIYITRGDRTTGEVNRLAFYCNVYNASTDTIEKYNFKLSDKITFVVFEKKGYTKKEILRKEFTLEELGYTEPTTTVEIPLTPEDTKKFPLKNKSVTYWYDLILNDSMTLLGYDDSGAKKIIVYPEAGELGE